MEYKLSQLELEEIREYRKELKQYIEKIPDELVYPYFDIMPMTDQEYAHICRDLIEGGYYTLFGPVLGAQKRLPDGQGAGGGKISVIQGSCRNVWAESGSERFQPMFYI